MKITLKKAHKIIDIVHNGSGNVVIVKGGYTVAIYLEEILGKKKHKWLSMLWEDELGQFYDYSFREDDNSLVHVNGDLMELMSDEETVIGISVFEPIDLEMRCRLQEGT